MIAKGSKSLKAYVGSTGVDKMYLGDTLVYSSAPAPLPNYLCFTALESGTFTVTIASALTTSQLQYIEYSVDECSTWTKTNNVNSQQIVITTPTVNEGDKVYWRGIGTQLAQNFSNNPTVVSSTCRFDASGEVMSLLKGDSFENSRNVGGSAFARLFLGCTTIINAEDMIVNASSIGSYGMQEMFKGCSNLVSTPQISSNGVYSFNSMFENCTSLDEFTHSLPIPSTVANRIYRGMFKGCTSLRKAPSELATITEFGASAYRQMFYGCTSLTDVPSILPSTSLTSGCYNAMFQGCTSLTYAPQLPATTVTGEGYNYMFRGCTSLVSVPNITVTQVTGYNALYGMFWGCSSLTDCPIKKVADFSNTGIMNSVFRDCSNMTGAIVLPAETLTANCYNSALRGTKISYIKMLATDISASNCLSNWLNEVPNVSTSIFVKHIDATWTTTGASGVPTNWTVIYYNPTTDKYYLSDKTTECDDHGNVV